MILLVCLSIPIYLFSQPSPDRSSQTLQFCLSNLFVMDSLMIEVNRLDKFIDIYETDLDRNRDSWFETLQWISELALPSRDFIDKWQEETIPDRKLATIQYAKLDVTYEMVKLGLIRERLAPMIESQYSYWQHIDEVEVVIHGLQYQIQVLIQRQEVFEKLLKEKREQMQDVLMRQRFVGEVWIAMKEDMKASYVLLEMVRTARPEDAEGIEASYLALSKQISEHFLGHAVLEQWPPDARDHVIEYYQILGFEILPRIKQVVAAHQAKHHAFFAYRFDNQLEELATHFAEMQAHLKQLAHYHGENQNSILSSAP